MNTPMLQSTHIITTPADVHEVLRTLGVANATNCATYVASTHAPKYFFGFFYPNSAVRQQCERIQKGLQ